MLKVPTKVVIEIEAGSGKGTIYAGDDVLCEVNGKSERASIAERSLSQKAWKKELRLKCKGVHGVNSFIDALVEMDDNSKLLFGELAACLNEMNNLHNGGE